ncbi:MAG: phosphoglycerate mutase [Xanthomonadales bacterium]|nr:phosphoglycerate mutase [Xanthomonadales bacterium]
MPALLWLPARRRLGALTSRLPKLRAVLEQGSRLADAEPGCGGLLCGVFTGLPAELPTAALTRIVDAPDDCGGRWLRADPCMLRVESAGVRMLACGALAPSADEVRDFCTTLQPLFADAGWVLHAAAPERWYVRPDAAHPRLGGQDPELVLGAYIDAALPVGDAGRATRRWLNELQMALHEHPCNRARRSRGQPEINSLWLHGDGVAPGSLRTAIAAAHSHDPLLRACMALAGVPALARPNGETDRILVDARDADDDATVELLGRLLDRHLSLQLQLESGERFAWRPWHRLRFWRRATP